MIIILTYAKNKVLTSSSLTDIGLSLLFIDGKAGDV